MSMIALLREKFSQFIETADREEYLSYLAALPLYFSWVPTFTWFSKVNKIREVSFYSAINTSLFFSLLVFAQVCSILPWIGNVISNLIHLVSIVFYLFISGFLIYSVRFKKTIEIPILSDWVKFLESNLAPIAQLDRVSDYGSEG